VYITRSGVGVQIAAQVFGEYIAAAGIRI